MMRYSILRSSHLQFIVLLITSSVIVWGKRGTGPVLIMEPGGGSNLIELSGRSVSTVLNCLVHGDPEPEVTWWTSSVQKFHDNRRHHLESLTTNLSPVNDHDDPVSTILPNNSLKIQIVAARNIHDRYYLCKASNKYGAILSTPVRVNSVAAQEYSTQVYDQYVITGNTAVLTCHLPSYVTQYVIVTAWIRDDNFRITPEDNGRKGSNGRLYVLGVSDDDSGRVYRCETRHKVSGATVVSQHGGRVEVRAPSSGMPPRIVDSMAEVKTNSGDKVYLPCAAQGHPPPIIS